MRALSNTMGCDVVEISDAIDADARADERRRA